MNITYFTSGCFDSNQSWYVVLTTWLVHFAAVVRRYLYTCIFKSMDTKRKYFSVATKIKVLDFQLWKQKKIKIDNHTSQYEWKNSETVRSISVAEIEININFRKIYVWWITLKYIINAFINLEFVNLYFWQYEFYLFQYLQWVTIALIYFFT